MYSVRIFRKGKSIYSVLHVNHDVLYHRLRDFLYYQLDIHVVNCPHNCNVVELFECIAHNGYDVSFWNGYSKKNYMYTHPINHDNVITCEVFNV